MQKVALLNGEMVELGSAAIRAVSAAAMYGHGVFTTLAVYGGEPFLTDKHRRRLRGNAHTLGIGDVSFQRLDDWLRRLIAANDVIDGRVRITLFDTGGAGLWTGNSEKRTEVLMVTGERIERADTFRLTLSPFAVNSKSPLAGVKSCNYLEHLIAYEDARRRGFDETVRLNERGGVASAAMANIFWLDGSRLFTPSLETGCLAGTTREHIMDNLTAEETSASIGQLMSADAVFISSAGIGIKRVASIDDRHYGLTDHEVLHLLPQTKTRMSAG